MLTLDRGNPSKGQTKFNICKGMLRLLGGNPMDDHNASNRECLLQHGQRKDNLQVVLIDLQKRKVELVKTHLDWI
jgi:hypothetical protein